MICMHLLGSLALAVLGIIRFKLSVSYNPPYKTIIPIKIPPTLTPVTNDEHLLLPGCLLYRIVRRSEAATKALISLSQPNIAFY